MHRMRFTLILGLLIGALAASADPRPSDIDWARFDHVMCDEGADGTVLRAEVRRDIGGFRFTDEELAKAGIAVEMAKPLGETWYRLDGPDRLLLHGADVAGEPVPVRFIFLLDVSRSMAERGERETRMQDAVSSLRPVLDTLAARAGVEVAIAGYGCDFTRSADFDGLFVSPSEAKAQLTYISEEAAGGWAARRYERYWCTALYNAVGEAHHYIAGALAAARAAREAGEATPGTRYVLVVVGDGRNDLIDQSRPRAPLDAAGLAYAPAWDESDANDFRVDAGAGNGIGALLADLGQRHDYQRFTIGFGPSAEALRARLAPLASGPESYLPAADPAALTAGLGQVVRTLDTLRLTVRVPGLSRTELNGYRFRVRVAGALTRSEMVLPPVVPGRESIFAIKPLDLEREKKICGGMPPLGRVVGLYAAGLLLLAGLWFGVPRLLWQRMQPSAVVGAVAGSAPTYSPTMGPTTSTMALRQRKRRDSTGAS